MTESSIDTTTAAPPNRSGASLGRLLTLLLPATTAMYGLFQGIQQILLPAQVEHIDAAAKVGNLALLTTLAAIASMIALPTGGAVSDRTRSRFGRRTPWIVIMSAVSGLLMVVMGLSTNLTVLAVAYMLLWFVANFYQGAISAILPDRVPVERRGVASAVIGLGTPLGILYAVNLVARVSQFWGYAIVGGIFVLASLALAFGAREESSRDLTRTPRTRRNTSHVVRSFFEAFASRDFTFAFISRAALFLSYFTVSGYLYYTLQDYVGAANLPDKANEGRDFGILAVATGLPQILSSVIAGALITFLGGYTALYIFGAACAVTSGVVIMRVRSVR
jgi:MFS family permease